MEKKTFWQRSEDYAKKVSGGTHRTDQGGSCAVAEAVEAGGAEQPGEPLDRQTLHGRQQPLPDEQGYPRWPGRQPLGYLHPDQEAGGQVRKGEKGTQVLFFTDRTARTAKDEQGKVLKDKDGKTIYEEEQRAYPICKQYTVFNVEQVDGLELKPRAGASAA